MTAMAEITLESFRDFLRRHRDVRVTFQASGTCNNPATFRYQLRDDGNIFEVYTYIRSIFPVCHIDDERNMSDIFLMSLRRATCMEPTGSEDKKAYSGIL